MDRVIEDGKIDCNVHFSQWGIKPPCALCNCPVHKNGILVDGKAVHTECFVDRYKACFHCRKWHDESYVIWYQGQYYCESCCKVLHF